MGGIINAQRNAIPPRKSPHMSFPGAIVRPEYTARFNAAQLATQADPLAALLAYEGQRREATARIVQTNRSLPPDFINIRVEELSGDKPFRHIDDIISQAELREISEHYKRVAGFSLDAVKS